MVRILEGYGGGYRRTLEPVAEPTGREKALADPSVPAVLKDLATRIIPQKLTSELQALVDSGALDPLLVPAAHPLFSPVTQMFTAENPNAWLKILFSKEPQKILEAKCPCFNFDTSSFSTDPDYRDPYSREAPAVDMPDLGVVLARRTNSPVRELAAISPALLALRVPDRYGYGADRPLLHELLNTEEFSMATFDALEAFAGNTDFLSIRNTRGETLFHCIASQGAWREDLTRLDVASWMLQKKPELANMPDRFGWTPLDRLVSSAGAQYDSSMCRLLVVSGARLEKQLAPKFNLEAELEARVGAKLDKPAPPKPALRSNRL